MDTAGVKAGPVRWMRALINGIMAWILAAILYMIPGIVLGIKLGIQLGPRSENPTAVSGTIEEQVSAMYQNSPLLMVLFVILLIGLIFWRARKVSRDTVDRRLINGLLVGLVPAAISLILILTSGEGLIALYQPVVYAGAGLAGGYSST